MWSTVHVRGSECNGHPWSGVLRSTTAQRCVQVIVTPLEGSWDSQVLQATLDAPTSTSNSNSNSRALHDPTRSSSMQLLGDTQSVLLVMVSCMQDFHTLIDYQGVLMQTLHSVRYQPVYRMSWFNAHHLGKVHACDSESGRVRQANTSLACSRFPEQCLGM